MKILELVLKAKWYDMISSGEKKEEYREIKPYWCNRLIDNIGMDYWKGIFIHNPIEKLTGDMCGFPHDFIWNYGNIHYDEIRFRRGYTNETMLFKLKEQVSIGIGKSEWGSPENKVFILKIGERIKL